jgi:hypothetical protein
MATRKSYEEGNWISMWVLELNKHGHVASVVRRHDGVGQQTHGSRLKWQRQRSSSTEGSRAMTLRIWRQAQRALAFTRLGAVISTGFRAN